MGCNCGKKASAQSLGWTVDLNVAAAGGKSFTDGTKKKTFVSVGEANIEIAKLGLGGKVRPRPAVAGDQPQ